MDSTIHETMLNARLAGQDRKNSFAANVVWPQPAHRPATPPARPTTRQKTARYSAEGLVDKKRRTFYSAIKKARQMRMPEKGINHPARKPNIFGVTHNASFAREQQRKKGGIYLSSS